MKAATRKALTQARDASGRFAAAGATCARSVQSTPPAERTGNTVTYEAASKRFIERNAAGEIVETYQVISGDVGIEDGTKYIVNPPPIVPNAAPAVTSYAAAMNALSYTKTSDRRPKWRARAWDLLDVFRSRARDAAPSEEELDAAHDLALEIDSDYGTVAANLGRLVFRAIDPDTDPVIARASFKAARALFRELNRGDRREIGERYLGGYGIIDGICRYRETKRDREAFFWAPRW